jgi:hypothetical protein
MKQLASPPNALDSEADRDSFNSPPKTFSELDDTEKELLLRYREDPAFCKALNALLFPQDEEELANDHPESNNMR